MTLVVTAIKLMPFALLNEARKSSKSNGAVGYSSWLL
jgi:hypothetical protein